MTETDITTTDHSPPADSVAPQVRPTATAPTAEERRVWLSFWRENLSSPRNAWRTVNDFSEELRRDPSFWPHVMAMRGGLIMTGFGTAIALAYAATLPFALAATLITGTVALAGAATIGVVAGGRYAWRHVQRALHSVKTGDDNVPLPPAQQLLPGWIKKLGEHKIIKSIAQSTAWQRAGAIIDANKKWMLGGTALGGSALTAGMGVWMLAAQAVVLPVVVLGMAVSVATLWAVGTIVAGGVGLYFGTTSVLRWHRESKKVPSAGVAHTPLAGVMEAAPTAVSTQAPCSQVFAAAQTPPAKADPVPANDQNSRAAKKTSPVPPGSDKV